MAQNPTYCARNPRTGLIEVIDMRTGAVLAVQRSVGVDLLGGGRQALVEHILPSGEKVLLERGIDPGSVVHTKAWPYSAMTADLICQLVAEGEPITKICSKEGFPPYHVFCRWKKEHPEFVQLLEEARRDRAEAMRDLALQEALAADEDSALAQKLKHEAYKWAAGVDDQSKYSPKAKVEAAGVGVIQLVVNTGINREHLREVTDVGENQSQAKVTTALPHGSGSAASASAGDEGQKITVEVPIIPSADAK